LEVKAAWDKEVKEAFNRMGHYRWDNPPRKT